MTLVALAPLAMQEAAAAQGGPASPVTFHEHVAPIIHRSCTACHRQGEIGPFELKTYDQVRKHGPMVKRVVRDRFMPPWLPVEGHGKFADEQRLSKIEIDRISAWVDAGMPEGDRAKAKAPPKFTDGWQLGKPDLVVSMPVGYVVPADGPDIYRSFVVPVNLQEDKWLTAIEVRPSARNNLHHIIFQMDNTGESRQLDGSDGRPGFESMGAIGRGARNARAGGASVSTSGLGGWAVGGLPRHLPMGLARLLPKGADIILQSHLSPSGKTDVEKTTLGLYFAKKPPSRTMVGLQLPPYFGLMAGINIPPDKKDFQIRDSFELPVDALAVTVGGHAHKLCTSMQVLVTPPGSKKADSVFLIDRWDFDWQNRYQYERPLVLTKGSKIEVVITYDNSADNKNNPNDPPKRIRWGVQSQDEMGSVTLLLVPKRQADADRLARAIRESSRRNIDPDKAVDGFMSAVISQLKMRDKNQDGIITKEEAGPAWRMAQRADLDGDGKITPEEIDELEKQVREGGLGRRR